jgi:hypothetical protein
MKYFILTIWWYLISFLENQHFIMLRDLKIYRDKRHVHYNERKRTTTCCCFFIDFGNLWCDSYFYYIHIYIYIMAYRTNMHVVRFSSKVYLHSVIIGLFIFCHTLFVSNIISHAIFFFNSDFSQVHFLIFVTCLFISTLRILLELSFWG